MKVTLFISGKNKYANVYLAKDESFDQYKDCIGQLKKEHRVIVFASGVKDYRNTLVAALTDSY